MKKNGRFSKRMLGYLLVAILLGGSGCATANLGNTTGGTPNGTNTQTEKAFIASAASSNQLGIKLSELALQRSGNLEVREFAKLTAQQYGKLNNELKSVAQQMRLVYATNLQSGHQARYDQVAKVNGPGFEKAFVQEMEALYQQNIAIYQQAGNDATNFALRAYALKNTPILQGHLRLATQLKNILP
jgi:putative membrane protein